jgi:nicotinamidase-related amidase
MEDYVLLIIDPQVDFHEGGSLAVIGVQHNDIDLGGYGGNSDSKNIIKLIQSRRPKAVYVSLDTHTPTHIGHQGFWQPVGNPGGEPPGVGSQFTVEIVDGIEHVAVGTQGQFAFYEPKSTGDKEKDTQLKEWVVHYVKSLTSGETGEKFSPCIWPNHCLEGEDGHKVHPGLKAALDTLANDGVPVEYHVKGQNEAAEMYSIFKAELPATMDLYRGMRNPINNNSKIKVPNTDVEDHANVNTNFNTELYKSLVEHNLPIVVCGEALSHCVKWSTNDLITQKEKDQNTLAVYLLEDASSVVNLEGLNLPHTIFVKPTEDFKVNSQERGVKWIKTDDLLQALQSANSQLGGPNGSANQFSKNLFSNNKKAAEGGRRRTQRKRRQNRRQSRRQQQRQSRQQQRRRF